jgi:hypothetical protein
MSTGLPGWTTTWKSRAGPWAWPAFPDIQLPPASTAVTSQREIRRRGRPGAAAGGKGVGREGCVIACIACIACVS